MCSVGVQFWSLYPISKRNINCEIALFFTVLDTSQHVPGVFSQYKRNVMFCVTGLHTRQASGLSDTKRRGMHIRHKRPCGCVKLQRHGRVTVDHNRHRGTGEPLWAVIRRETYGRVIVDNNETRETW